MTRLLLPRFEGGQVRSACWSGWSLVGAFFLCEVGGEEVTASRVHQSLRESAAYAAGPPTPMKDCQ
jgi:hypothetical protein